MTTKATKAFFPPQPLPVLALPAWYPPRDICWGQDGCGLRLAASLLAGGSWTEGWAWRPKKRQTEHASNVEEEKKKIAGSIPGFCHGAPVGGRFKVIKGLEMASGWEVEKRRIRGGFFFIYYFGCFPDTQAAWTSFCVCVCVCPWTTFDLWRAALEFIRRFRDFSCLGAVQDTQQLLTHMRTVHFWQEQLRGCRKPQYRVMFFYSDLGQYLTEDLFYSTLFFTCPPLHKRTVSHQNKNKTFSCTQTWFSANENVCMLYTHTNACARTHTHQRLCAHAHRHYINRPCIFNCNWY